MSKKMTVKKVNIDELLQLLMDLRQTVEYVDMQIEEDNILRVKKHSPEKKKPKKSDDMDLNIDDINQLIV